MWKYICWIIWLEDDDGSPSPMPDVLSIIYFNTDYAKISSNGYKEFETYRYIHNYKIIADYGIDSYSEVALDSIVFDDNDIFDTLQEVHRDAIRQVLSY